MDLLSALNVNIITTNLPKVLVYTANCSIIFGRVFDAKRCLKSVTGRCHYLAELLQKSKMSLPYSGWMAGIKSDTGFIAFIWDSLSSLAYFSGMPQVLLLPEN